MALAEWFATIDLGKPTQAQQAVVDELGAMLDDYRPARLDRKASSIQATGHGWTLDHTIAVQLAHADDPDAMIELAVGTGEVIVSWLTAHEHLYADEDSPDGRPWPGRVVDLVAAVLRGELEVEDTYRGRWLVKTRIIDVAGPAGPRVLVTTGSLLGWLPRPGARQVERRRISWGVRPA
ncbi:MAG TPA: hypothetical protein VFA46_20170 [Actinomycetes bacterium]|jgi:hypothetical protein|nr:hypothetical protein [Actinomycetes bacterium]